MINVQEALANVPHFERLCSIDRLYEFVESLRADERFKVKIAGTSVNGAPIYHVRFGNGAVKALFVAFPHCMEPVGGLTVYSLMALLRQGHPALLDADVSWHIVPCIDPDGARINESWSQKPFDAQRFMKEFYLQPFQDQADTSFPFSYKKMNLEREPSKEGKVLQGILAEVRPDFYFDLHNHFFGGAFFFMSRDPGAACHREIYRLLDELKFPVQKRPPYKELAHFGEGVVEIPFARKIYDHLERTVPDPEAHVPCACSFDYLEQIKPDAFSFIAEMGFVRHPDDESERDTGLNLRRFKLRVDADSKYLATVLCEEWEKVKDEVDKANPLYRVVAHGHFMPKEANLLEQGCPIMRSTRDILFNPQYARTMTEAERFNSCIFGGGFSFLFQTYQFVRLLKESPPTPGVQRAVERLQRTYDEILEEIQHHVDFSAFAPVELDTLLKVQLGSGLIVLNSILKASTRENCRTPDVIVSTSG